ncbi:PEG10: Retrotransposon-derived protein PEG10 [Crotalus adamanteus]|uniref:PEG10: Retrotransposon-derived protein PEG10 n=1 Tax=Crotalus adamanteus TaxID=8729 RepID=A0AAW1C5B1_CROAD
MLSGWYGEPIMQFIGNGAPTTATDAEFGAAHTTVGPTPIATPAVQPVLQRSRRNLPKRFGGESERMRTFIAESSAAQWAFLIIETNDSVMNDFMVNFRSHLRNAIGEVTVPYEIHQLKQGNRKIRLYKAKFKLITADIGQNEADLIAHTDKD